MTAATHREAGRRYELPGGAKARIDWSVLEGYTVTDAAVEHRVEAVHYDTASTALDRRRVVLRRCRGGSDDGWHAELREEGGRHEARFPLQEGAPGRMPDAVVHLVEGLTGGQPLHPVTTLRTTRRVLSIAGVSGEPVGEVAFDDVESLDGRSGTQRSWSEWQVQLVGGSAAEDHRHRFFAAVEQALVAAGGRRSTAPAGTARTPGAEDGGAVAAPDGPGPGAEPTGADVLVTVLGQLAEQLVLWDLKVRLDVPDAVHQMRVTSRSLRSVLRAASPLLAGAAARELDGRLRELARALSGARDAEVTAELLPARVAALGGRVGPAAAQALQHTARQQAEDAADAVRAHLGNPGHLRLLADVVAFAGDPPVTERCRRLSARKVSDRMLRRALRRAQRAGARGITAEDAGAEAGPEHRLEHLHEVRKDVKRVRYVHAALKRSGFPPGPAAAHAAADAKAHQEVLGEIMDAGVLAGWLGRTAASCAGTGEDRYAVGLLHGAELAVVRTGIESGHGVVAELVARLREDLS